MPTSFKMFSWLELINKQQIGNIAAKGYNQKNKYRFMSNFSFRSTYNAIAGKDKTDRDQIPYK